MMPDDVKHHFPGFHLMGSSNRGMKNIRGHEIPRHNTIRSITFLVKEVQDSGDISKDGLSPRTTILH